jgi:hypothetical protein
MTKTFTENIKNMMGKIILKKFFHYKPKLENQ